MGRPGAEAVGAQTLQITVLSRGSGRLPMTSCPERTRSASPDPGARSQGGRKTPLTPSWGVRPPLHPSLGGPSLIWVAARLPACDPPSQLGMGVGITQH